MNIIDFFKERIEFYAFGVESNLGYYERNPDIPQTNKDNVCAEILEGIEKVHLLAEKANKINPKFKHIITFDDGSCLFINGKYVTFKFKG